MSENEGQELVPVFEANDELAAELVLGLLESEGVPAMIHPHELILESALSEDPGGWGEIVVPESEADRARKIIEEYLSAANADTPEPKAPKEDAGDESQA